MIKLYEALGAIGDDRIEMHDDSAKVWSSSRNKAYDVQYDSTGNAVMANDNGSYWQGYLGYPGLAYILLHGVVGYDPLLSKYLSGFAWNDINSKTKNDWDQTEKIVRDEMIEKHPALDLGWFDNQLARIMREIMALGLQKLGPRVKPPRA
jgi:hypothetical protein